MACVSTAAFLTGEPACMLATPLFFMYNESEKSRARLKYLYYIAYPMHLFLIVALR